MKAFKKSLLVIFLMLCCLWTASAQSGGDDIFVPISKYLAQGDAQSLSAWFGDSVEISVLSKGGSASKSQARQILKMFFDSYHPHAFDISHVVGNSNMKYALGTLAAGGETFRVSLFVFLKEDSFTLQQLEISRNP